jgi:excisionase family DNA binding protein
MKKLLTIMEAAERIGMSRQWIREVIKKGALPFPYIPVGVTHAKFNPDEIDAWLERITVPAGGGQKKRVVSHTATPQEATPAPVPAPPPPPVTPVKEKPAPVKSPGRQAVASASGNGKPVCHATAVKKIRRKY